MTWSQQEDAGGILKDDTQVRANKVRWIDLEKIKGINNEAG